LNHPFSSTRLSIRPYDLPDRPVRPQSASPGCGNSQCQWLSNPADRRRLDRQPAWCRTHVFRIQFRRSGDDHLLCRYTCEACRVFQPTGDLCGHGRRIDHAGSEQPKQHVAVGQSPRTSHTRHLRSFLPAASPHENARAQNACRGRRLRYLGDTLRKCVS
jgi:hypothetical protein